MKRVQRVVTFDEADFNILSYADEAGIFRLPVFDPHFPMPLRMALRRCQTQDWIKLIDVVIVPEVATMTALARVFMLTDAGRQRLADLRLMFPSEEEEIAG